MFFSSNPSNLPVVDDLVCIYGSEQHYRPYQVTQRERQKSTGQVWYWVTDAETRVVMPKIQAEILSWWPGEGDQVLVVMEPYLMWLAHQLEIVKKGVIVTSQTQKLAARLEAASTSGKTTEQLTQVHYLERVFDDGLGAIRRKGGPLFKCPISCLKVLEKANGKTDSQSKQAAQMSLLEDAA